MSRARGSLGSRRGQKRPSRRWLLLFLALAIVIAAGKTCAAVTGRSNPIDTALTHLTTPLVNVVRSIGQGFSLVWNIPSALRDNVSLKAERDLLERRVEELKNVEADRRHLVEQYGLEPLPQFATVTARVIARPYDLWFDSAWISAGSRHGVRKGNLVANDDGVVGVVTETHTTSSNVMLISSPELALGAITRDTRVEGVIHGFDATRINFDLIPAGSPVDIGDKLFTLGESTYPGGEDNRPRGVYIGVVSRVVDSGGFLDIAVEPAASVNRLGWVVVYTQ